MAKPFWASVRVEMLGELALSDVGNEADMGAGRLHRPATIENAEMAAIPGAAKQGREVTLGLAHGMERGGEFFREQEQAPVGGWLLIAQSIDKPIRNQASVGDAGLDPRSIDFREEAADLLPAGAFAGLAGFADQHDEEVETMAGGVDHAVRAGADQVAEGSEQLEQNGGGLGLSVRCKGADGESGQPIESGFAEGGPGGRRGWGRRSGVVGVQVRLRLRLNA